MDEKPTVPPFQRPKRPANANKGASVHARAKKSESILSKESRFVGYMVLGFGVIAVASVLLIAASRFGGKAHQNGVVLQTANDLDPAHSLPQAHAPLLPSARPDSQGLQDRVAKDLLENLAAPAPAGSKTHKSPPKDELYFKRQPNLNIAAMEGAWQAIVGNATAVLQISKGVYQIVMADPAQYSYRRYSSGTYSVLDDMVILTPRGDWAPPAPPKGTDVIYASITTAPFPVMVGFKGKKMLWQNPPSTERRLYVPRTLPLLNDPEQGVITWLPVQR